MIYKIILLFLFYSIAGWIMEIIFTFITDKKFINRGFLIGPYCPIYGFGCLLFVFFLTKYDEIWAIFALTLLICSTLEYFTSWIMEKLFKLRWWDYTKMRFNINGRICLETMIPFSIMGTLVVKYINPFLLTQINKIPLNVATIISIILLTIFIIDILISCNVVMNLKYVTSNIKKDSTEEIKKAIHKFIHNNLYMYERIIKAYPNMKKIIKEKTDKTKSFFSNLKESNKKSRKKKNK